VADLAKIRSKLGLIVAVLIVVLGTGLIVWHALRPEEPPEQQASSSALGRVQGGDTPAGSAGESVGGSADPSSSDGQTSSSGQAAGETSKDLGGASGDSGGAAGALGERPLVAVFGVERYGETSRPDAVAVIGIEKQTSDPVLISLDPDQPLRDVGTIASVYADFGPEIVARLVGELLSLPLTQYVVLDYQVFESVIDKLGGIEVDVKQSIGVRSADGSRVAIQPGFRRLSGQEALAYIRYKWAGDERARLARQAAFLQGLRARLSERSTIGALPSLVRDVFALIKTNISLPAAVGIVESLRWAEMDRYRLVVITDELRGDDDLTSYKTASDFALSALELEGAESSR
jgi:LCP family protein required for cell wall assembly